jgi:hypothetical protein
MAKASVAIAVAHSTARSVAPIDAAASDVLGERHLGATQAR